MEGGAHVIKGKVWENKDVLRLDVGLKINKMKLKNKYATQPI